MAIEKIKLLAYDSSEAANEEFESIEHASENRLVLDSHSFKINFNNRFYVDDGSILYKYKELLKQYTIQIKIEKSFFYHPELVAKELYGTVDLWYLVTWFSYSTGAYDFNQEVIRVFNPKRMSIINYLLNKHAKELEANRREIPVVEDLTLQKVKIREY